MQTFDVGSCSSAPGHMDAMDSEFPGFKSTTRRSSRRRTFRKTSDMDFDRMLGEKQGFSIGDFLTLDKTGQDVPGGSDTDRNDPAPWYSSTSSDDQLPDELQPDSSMFDMDLFSNTDCFHSCLFEEQFFSDRPFLDEAEDIFGFGADGIAADTSNMDTSMAATHDPAPETEASSPCSATAESFMASAAASASARAQQAHAATSSATTSKKSVLVAKILTKSDAHAKRIILPRVAVEANLSMLLHEPTFVVTAKDTDGKQWKFVVKSWSNGHNPKPVYVMEQVADYLRAHELGIGDAVGILIDEDGLLIEHNTNVVRSAAERPTYCGFTTEQVAAILAKQNPATPSRAIAIPKPSSSSVKADYSASSFQTSSSAASSCDTMMPHVGGVLMCMRTHGCSRPAGHQGWCSGHKGFKRRKAADSR